MHAEDPLRGVAGVDGDPDDARIARVPERRDLRNDPRRAANTRAREAERTERGEPQRR